MFRNSVFKNKQANLLYKRVQYFINQQLNMYNFIYVLKME